MGTRFYDERVGFQCPSTGDTGNLAIGSRVGPSFILPSETSPAIADGQSPVLLVQEGDDFMIVEATYNAAGPDFTVDAVRKSKIGGTVGTTRMTLAGAAEIRFLPPDKTDLNKLFVRADRDQSSDFDEASKTRMRGSVLCGYAPGAQGRIYGLKLSNSGGDTTNDIDIGGGGCQIDQNGVGMALASTLTKQLDASWAVGTGQGGRDTGSIADGTWHVFLIQRSDTGVVDALFSLSPTSPTMPANYDRKRRIGSILREAGGIVQFIQRGDRFYRVTPKVDLNGATSQGSSAVTRTLSVPTGIVVWPIFTFEVNVTANGVAEGVIFTALEWADTAPSNGYCDGRCLASGTASIAVADGNVEHVYTNTSAQIRSRQEIGSSSTGLYIVTRGWVDQRGQDT